MLILESDYGLVSNTVEAGDSDEYYAMVDSGTNAIILPLHPQMVGDIAECQVPSATVTGPIVQEYEFDDSKRLVIALPQSTILVSQEWLTTIAQWTFTSRPSSLLVQSNPSWFFKVICLECTERTSIFVQGSVLASDGPYVQKSSIGEGTFLGRIEEDA